MKLLLNMVIIFLLLVGLVFGALVLTLNQLQAVWTIRVADGMYGVKQIKSFTFLLFDHSLLNITLLIDWVPIALLVIGAILAILTGRVKIKTRAHSIPPPSSKNETSEGNR